MHGIALPVPLPGPPLSTRDAIADTCFTAFAALDHEDEPLLRASCTPDIYTLIAGKECNGYAELKARVFDNVGAKLDTVHYLTNVRVAVDTETTGRVTFTAQAVHCPLGKGYEGRKFTTGAIYTCEVVKGEGEGQEWKLKKMRSYHVWGDGDASVMGGH